MKRIIALMLFIILLTSLLSGCSDEDGHKTGEVIRFADYDVSIAEIFDNPNGGITVYVNLECLKSFYGTSNISTAILTTEDEDDYAVTSDVYIDFSFDWDDPETTQISLYFMTLKQPKELYLEIERIGEDDGTVIKGAGCFDIETNIGRVIDGDIPVGVTDAYDRSKLKNWFNEISPEDFIPEDPKSKHYIVFVTPVIDPVTQSEVTDARADWTAPSSADDILDTMMRINGLILTDNPDHAMYAYIISLDYEDKGYASFTDGSTAKAYDAVYKMEIRNLVTGESLYHHAIAEAAPEGLQYNADSIKKAHNKQIYGVITNPMFTQKDLLDFIQSE